MTLGNSLSILTLLVSDSLFTSLQSLASNMSWQRPVRGVWLHHSVFLRSCRLPECSKDRRAVPKWRSVSKQRQILMASSGYHHRWWIHCNYQRIFNFQDFHWQWNTMCSNDLTQTWHQISQLDDNWHWINFFWVQKPPSSSLVRLVGSDFFRGKVSKDLATWIPQVLWKILVRKVLRIPCSKLPVTCDFLEWGSSEHCGPTLKSSCEKWKSNFPSVSSVSELVKGMTVFLEKPWMIARN